MTIGFAFCGSYCTFAQVFPVLEELAKQYQVIPIISSNVAVTNSRFGTAAEHIARITSICGRPPLDSINSVEPIGPKK